MIGSGVDGRGKFGSPQPSVVREATGVDGTVQGECRGQGGAGLKRVRLLVEPRGAYQTLHCGEGNFRRVIGWVGELDLPVSSVCRSRGTRGALRVPVYSLT